MQENRWGDILTEGILFNIQKYCVHDGPGIRTTVFLKGCPLDCWWCHNPESKESRQRIVFRREKCLGCGRCIEVCREAALTFNGGEVIIDEKVCRQCGECSKHCPSEAMELIGKKMTVGEVMKEIEKDRIFYDESGGGVTFSGGEPLVQHRFLYELLTLCRQRGMHTAVDTSGYAPWEVLSRISEQTDLFLYDIKHIEEEKHIQFTGVSNRLILDNLKKLAAKHKNIHIRFPVIPGMNDCEENIRKISKLISSIPIKNVNILPYHNIGIDKYTQLGERYRLPQLQPPSHEVMNQIKEAMEKFGLQVKIGG